MAEDFIVALTGPTASGKTQAAMALADRYPVSLISMDSAMVYKDMDIGTAKPSPQELEQYPHALIDIRKAHETYSVAQFVDDADREVRRILAEGKLPLLVGGSMLYLKAFREGIAPMPAADQEVRQQLSDEAHRRGTRALYERLQKLDPEAAARIHPNNFSRIQRALEVHALSGEPISGHWSAAKSVQERLSLRLLEFGVEPESREALHARIEARLDRMLESGLIDEVAALKRRISMHVDLPSMRAVGYRQVWEHLDGLTSFEEMREKVLAATRQLAKRQLTWMRGWPGLLTMTRQSGNDLASQIVAKVELTD
ncbi:MAG: tRNA (adenosine(37)-N6)-dimethylallyltransferase MiaA [Gammaproteobacteria bacterium]|nr:MAG: tRNA (adenosine(37)-N6)-dimethylallyltransferase MiaA [Gammaproteobacteria bacterium]